jgi:hypothetical protein
MKMFRCGRMLSLLKRGSRVSDHRLECFGTPCDYLAIHELPSQPAILDSQRSFVTDSILLKNPGQTESSPSLVFPSLPK